MLKMEEILAQLTDEQKEELEKLCKEKGISKSELLESLICSIGTHLNGGLIADDLWMFR